MRLTRAARLFAPGTTPRLVDVEVPEPGPDEVLVEVDYAALNPFDTYAAAGQVGDVNALPRTLGVEGTGRLDGRPVVVQGAGLGLFRDGTWAGTVLAPRTCVVDLPDGVDPVQASALSVAGVTAMRVVNDVSQVVATDRVLILGAAGGVGSIALQLTKLAGATAYAQVGSDDKRDTVAALGADRVLVCDAAGLAAAVADFRPTVVLDALGGPFLAAAVDVAAPAGRIVSYGVSAGPQTAFPTRAFYRKGLRLLGYAGMRAKPAQAAEGVRTVAAAVAAGRIRVPIGAVVPLSRLDEAFALLRDRAVIGKIVLDVRS